MLTYPRTALIMLPMLDARHDFPLRRAVAAELIGDQDAWRPALPLQQLAQQPPGGKRVTPPLDKHVEHAPTPVEGAPEPVLHTSDPHRHLILSAKSEMLEVPMVLAIKIAAVERYAWRGRASTWHSEMGCQSRIGLQGWVMMVPSGVAPKMFGLAARTAADRSLTY